MARARLVVVCVWALSANPSSAQDAPPPRTPPAEEGAPPAESAPVLRPPEVVSIPEVEVPADVEMPPDGTVLLRLRILPDGSALVDGCDAPASVCAAIREAMERAELRPATRDGEPIEARIAMRFTVTQAEERPEGPADPRMPDEPDGAVQDAPPPAIPDADGFSAQAIVERPAAGALRLELEEVRELPGAFGDPFRAVEALPGVTPILSGLPYFYVRGAPPSGTLYVYDDIPLPALYHLGLGPAVVHPAMVGPLRLHSGVPPARFGRLIGGVIEAEGPPLPEDDEIHGEVELRLLDVGAMVDAPVGDGRLTVAGRYGYPGLLLSILSPEVDLAYWDYQLRFSHPVGRRDSVQLVTLGSFDRLDVIEEGNESSLSIQFHRVELRLVRRLAQAELGAALRFGWEESAFSTDDPMDVDQNLSLDALKLGPRVWAHLRDGTTRLRLGAEMIGSAGTLSLPVEESGDELGPQDPARNQAFAGVAARNTVAAWAELTWEPLAALSLDLGIRSDVWMTGPAIEAAVDPRLRATWRVADALDLFAAVGVTRQPAVFFAPVPGLSDVAIDRGLQTAVQGELGASARLPLDLELEAQLFVHRYYDLMFPDLVSIDEEACTEYRDEIVCEELEVDPRVDGASYGGELFLRRDPSHRLAGFLSYTLARATVDETNDIAYTPSYDIRHVVNVAGRWSIGGGFSASARIHGRSGKPLGQYFVDPSTLSVARYEQRLPGFWRLDVQLAYAWRTSWGRMRLALEWFNVTFAEEPADIDCGEMVIRPAPDSCAVEYTPPITAPNLGLRGTF